MPRFQSSELYRIISENLALLNREFTSVEERRLAHLCDRAALLARDLELLTSEDRCERFGRIFSKEKPSEETAGQSVGYIDGCLGAQLLADKLAVCGFLAKYYSPIGELEQRIFAQDESAKNTSDELNGFDESDEYDKYNGYDKSNGYDKTNSSDSPRNGESPAAFKSEESRNTNDSSVKSGSAKKVAYLRNAYADRAFRRFCEQLGELSVVYCTDFESVCEEVYYGRADMCILPLDSSRDAKLIGFVRLVDKYELKIVLSCGITSPDQSVTTRYALLSKNIEYPSQIGGISGSPLFFEFSFVPDETNTLAGVLAASELCRLRPYKVDAIPLTYSDNEFSYDVVLNCNGGELDTFALYMYLSVPQYEPLGVYLNLGGEN